MSVYQADAYLRLSYTADRTEESDSIQNQKKLIQDFVAVHPDIEIVSERVDDGYSGVLFNRPAFLEMMEDIKAGKVNCVIVKDLSRLGREYIETGRYLRRIFPAFGVRFISINDNIDTANERAGDDLTIGLKNMINDAYCHDISVKTRSALKAKREKGDYVGACPVFGYQKDPENHNRLVIDGDAARVVRDIYRRKIDGASAKRIADELNRLGVLSPSQYKINRGLPHPSGGFADVPGAKWSAKTVLRILQDETYTGVLLQGKQETYNHKLKNLVTIPQDEWVRTEDAHEPIIPRRDFDLVQKILSLDTRIAPDGSEVYLFSGLLICGCCGGPMTRKIARSGRNQYIYYYCPTGRKRGCENPVMVREDALTSCVLESLQGHIQSVIVLDKLLDSMGEEQINRELVASYTAQIRENEVQLDKAKEFKRSLYEKFINGLVTKQEYREWKAGYSNQIEQYQEAIAALRQNIENAMHNNDDRQRWMQHFKQFSTMKELDRRAVITLIQSIRVLGKQELDITYRYQAEYEQELGRFSHGREAV